MGSGPILASQLINEAEVKASRDAPVCSVDAAQVLKSWAAGVSGLIKSIDRRHLVSLGRRLHRALGTWVRDQARRAAAGASPKR